MLWDDEFLEELVHVAINGEVGKVFNNSPVVFQGAQLPWRSGDHFDYQVSFKEPIGEIGMVFHLLHRAGITILKIPVRYLHGVECLDMLEDDFNRPAA